MQSNDRETEAPSMTWAAILEAEKRERCRRQREFAAMKRHDKNYWEIEGMKTNDYRIKSRPRLQENWRRQEYEYVREYYREPNTLSGRDNCDVQKKRRNQRRRLDKYACGKAVCWKCAPMPV